MNTQGLNMDEGNTLIQCPYEQSHLIMRKRFQIHLDRCRKHHSSVSKVVCPFNSSHILNKVELNWHVSVCAERLSFEKFRHRDEHGIIPTAEPQKVISNICDENWDDEPDVPTYDPTSYASAAPVLRLRQNAPPSEKKEFRQQERMRLMKLKNQK